MLPLAIDLFCGLGGWTAGLLAEGYAVVGIDTVRHDYGNGLRYAAPLIVQDVRTLHGRQFRHATLLVASPPCQTYSYMAMPWRRAKQLAAEYRSGHRPLHHLTALFDACFRLQREATTAAGHHIPLIVENVRGAQPWVGPARAHYGSFYLWGDVPTRLPLPPSTTGLKQPGLTGVRRNGKGSRWFQDGAAHSSSRSAARRTASALMAVTPFPLAQYIARLWKPT